MRVGLQSNNIKLINEFISSCSNFWNEDISEIDNKHFNIVSQFEKTYKKNIEKFSREIIDWEAHSDNGSPFQITFHHLKKTNLSTIVKNSLKEILKILLSRQYDKQSFLDDVDIIKKTGGYKLLKEFPAHLSDLRQNVYFLEKNVSATYRWLRYIYISNIIINKKLLHNNEIWVDIGSYYGGVQSILKSKYQNTTFFLVDFNHQLCRSYVYLKNIYPEVNHILPDTINHIKDINSIEKGSIVYLKVKDFQKINSLKVNLITNFFSFGEMKRNTFYSYFNSDIINNANILYLINRFVSSPFFEKTYDSDLNIFDYLNEKFSNDYFDIFPMHHYYKFRRKLFNRMSNRPISSPYFEMILKNIKIDSN